MLWGKEIDFARHGWGGDETQMAASKGRHMGKIMGNS